MGYTQFRQFVRQMVTTSDANLDGVLNKKEFRTFLNSMEGAYSIGVLTVKSSLDTMGIFTMFVHHAIQLKNSYEGGIQR